MLRAIAAWLGNSECYCAPCIHLREFYGPIGFIEIARAAAPAFLAERFAEYQRRALNVTILSRPAA